LVADILRAAPGLKIIVTSRERLNLSGEMVFPIGGMDVPDQRSEPHLLDYSGPRLFIESARRASGHFEVRTVDVASLLRICHLLGGMPLGILLAAAWVPLLSLREIAAEIERGLDILETETRDAPERHQSIRAVFEHSWALLSDEEQAVFRRLTVFHGGFDREAAQTVTGASLRTLRTLLDKSLIQRVNEARYDIHELLRQFGEEKLQASAEVTAIRQTHASYFAEFTHLHWRQNARLEQIEVLLATDNDYDNLRAAWLFAAQNHQVDLLRQMDMGLTSYWFLHCRYFEAIALIEQAEAMLRPGPLTPQTDIMCHRLMAHKAQFYAVIGEREDQTKSLIRQSYAFLQRAGDDESLLLALGILTGIIGYVEGWPLVQHICEEGLSLARSLGDRWNECHFLKLIGMSYRNQGNYALAQQYCEAALQIAQEIGDQFAVASNLTTILGEIAILTNDLDTAQSLLERGLHIYQSLNFSSGISSACSRLGRVAIARSRFDDAQRYFLESLRLNRETGRRRELLFDIFDFARLNLAQGKNETALELLSLIRDHPLADAAWLIEQSTAMLETLEAELAPDLYAMTAARGRELDLDTVAAALLSET
jgi:predicted ATPase